MRFNIHQVVAISQKVLVLPFGFTTELMMSVYHIFIIKLVNYHITIAVFILMYAQANTTLAIVTLSLYGTAV